MTAFWTPPPIFAGQSPVFIIGGGASLADVSNEHMLALNKRPTIAVNNIGLDYVTGSTILFFADGQWLDWNGDRLWKHAGQYKVTTQWRTGNRHLVEHNVKRMVYRPDLGLSRDPRILTGMDGGGRAINLAVHAGAEVLVLIGFDGRPGNYHRAHRVVDSMPDRYAVEFIPSHRLMAQHLRAIGVRVFNATPDSAYDCYEPTRLEDWL